MAVGSRGSNFATTLIITFVGLALVTFVNLRSSIIVTTPSTPECDSPPAIIYQVAEKKSECKTLCDCLSHEAFEDRNLIPTAASLWKRHSSDILEASIRLDEAPNKTQEYLVWVEELFSLSSSSRLVKSFETFPHDSAALRSIYAILQKRFEQPDTSRPLKVAVFGGSLTAGHGCLANPLGMASQSFMRRQLPCAWPARVQQLLDKFAPGLVNITNMAMAATTSDVGATVIDYQLWPPELLPDGPDVIVASFATNDALAEAPETEIYQNMQLLVESIHKERNCNAEKLPLLFYVDDFIAWPGPVQQWLDFHHDLHELADWHGFGYISYANAFRDLIQVDLMQSSPFKGDWKIGKRGKYEANPHPGMAFHIAMSWILSYNILHLALHMCDGSLQEPDTPPQNANTHLAAMPLVQRPPLDSALLTEDIPKKWKMLATSEEKRCASIKKGPRCGFVWVANRVSEFRSSKAIEAFLKKYLTKNEQWKADGDSYRSKHGWVAQKEKAQFVLEIASLETDVRFLTILSLKSYGELWAGSRMSMKVLGKEFFIDGVHNSTTSVIIPHKFDLGEVVSKGDALKVTFDLVGGSTFKITGMAFCSQ